jgi:hypothetical protein
VFTDISLIEHLLKMAKTKVSLNIAIEDEYFIPEKTSDVFREVEFQYEESVWNGVLPKFLEKQGLDLTESEFDKLVEENYNLLDPKNKDKWIVESDKNWTDKTTATYKVLAALYSGN